MMESTLFRFKRNNVIWVHNGNITFLYQTTAIYQLSLMPEAHFHDMHDAYSLIKFSLSATDL